jgi:hypothetical protein
MTTPTVYDFRIDAWKPETLPMARLADYLDRLAVLFGHAEHVHFMKVRKGSAVPEIHVDATAALKVQARLNLVAGGGATEDATKAVRKINDLLRADNASATLAIKGGGRILAFPGCKTPLAEEAVVIEAGELTGTVIRVGGKDETVPLLLQDADGTTYTCNTTRAIAKELARHLFGDLVRVRGVGRWRRTPDRVWELDDFKLQSWELLEQVPLTVAVEGLRAVKGSEWNAMADPQAELKRLREA